MNSQGNGLEARMGQFQEQLAAHSWLPVTGSAKTANLALTTQNVAQSAETGQFAISPHSSVTFTPSTSTYGAVMADITREEMDAKLATIEQRAETRFVELSGKFDRIADSITALNGTIKTELEGVKTELATVKADNKYTRLTIIIAVVGSVIAGLAALWVTQQNLLAAFQTGLSVKSEQPSPSAPPTPPRPNTRQ